MGKLKQGIEGAGTRIGNTAVTPLRRTGEIANALANIPRQSISSAKNINEVRRQTRDALVDNFLNFSKVEGKRYEKMVKVPVNLASAVTRRPAMIAGAGVASGLNQGIRQPFKKLLYTPVKMFKGLGNATRIFSKKKGFDFQTYDTHETTGDTRVNELKDRHRGFFGKGGPSEAAPKEKQKEAKKATEQGEGVPHTAKDGTESGKEQKPKEQPKPEKQKEEKPKEERKPKEQPKKEEPKKATEQGEGVPHTAKDAPGGGKEQKPKEQPKPAEKKVEPKNIAEVNKQRDEESKKKAAEEKEKDFPDRKTLDKDAKAERRKEYEKLLKGNLSENGVLARGKEHEKGDSIEEILKHLKDNEPTLAGFIQEEILAKKKQS